MRDALLELKANHMRNAGLSFLVADEFENTIHIQSYNDEDELLGKFEEYTVCNEGNLRIFLKNVDGTGLESINDDNEIPKEVNWSKVEDQAMEEETLLAIQNAPTEKIKAPIKKFPNRIMNNQEGKPLVEWNGILMYSDKGFLCEEKHNMTLSSSSINRLKKFPKKLEATAGQEFKQLLGKQHIGVVFSGEGQNMIDGNISRCIIR
ncbi:10728_t:CDS:2 [Entrophospora sp. SA101]|nr:10728_t:CDS:2 [Entrophospora sp. SA101]